MQIVSRMAVRCRSVTAGDTKTVVGLSMVSGKRPLLPAQNERVQRDILSEGIVVRMGPGLYSSMLGS
jgi:hypothetical protein